MMDDPEARIIARKSAEVLERVAIAANRAGVASDGVRVVGVSKRKPAEAISAAFVAGILEFGENYVQEAESKRPGMPEGAILHMVGGLQRNKVRKAAALFDMVQSIDSGQLAEALDRACRDAGRTMDVLVELNIGGEAGKSGVLQSDLIEMLGCFAGLDCLKCIGLMVIPPAEGSHRWFPAARNVFETAGGHRLGNVDLRILSMGMSADFEMAIAEGSNMVRIGRAIFGERQ